jgi:hypothetical protein
VSPAGKRPLEAVPAPVAADAAAAEALEEAELTETGPTIGPVTEDDKQRYPFLESALNEKDSHFWAVAQARFYSRKPFQRDAAARASMERFYPALTRAFVARHGGGPSCWCQSVPAGAALTTKHRWWGRSQTHLRIAYPPSVDWPDGTAPLYQCERLKDLIEDLLRGTQRERCLRSVYVVASHGLAALDDDQMRSLQAAARARKVATELMRTGAAAPDPVQAQAAERARRQEHQARRRGHTERLKTMIDYVDGQTREAVARSVQLTYLVGVAIGAILVGAIAAGIAVWGHDARHSALTYIACALAGGAGGAVLSVLSRLVGNHTLKLDSSVGRRNLYILGGVRPLLGALSGLVLYLLLSSELIGIGPTSNGDAAALYAAIGFVSGFGERIAPDSLGALGQQLTASA